MTFGNFFAFFLFNATDCSQFYIGLEFLDLGPDGNFRNFLNVTFE